MGDRGQTWPLTFQEFTDWAAERKPGDLSGGRKKEKHLKKKKKNETTILSNCVSVEDSLRVHLHAGGKRTWRWQDLPRQEQQELAAFVMDKRVFSAGRLRGKKVNFAWKHFKCSLVKQVKYYAGLQFWTTTAASVAFDVPQILHHDNSSK